MGYYLLDGRGNDDSRISKQNVLLRLDLHFQRRLLVRSVQISWPVSMAEGSAASRYVKLRKEQAPVEDITPGELNQPIDVPQVDNLSLSLCI